MVEYSDEGNSDGWGCDGGRVMDGGVMEGE